MTRIAPINEWCVESKRNSLVRKIIYDSIKINNTYSIKKLIFLATLPSLFSMSIVKLPLLLHIIVIFSGMLSIARFDFLE